MKIRDLIIEYTPKLEEVSPTARLDIEVLISHVLGFKERIKLMMSYDRVLEESEIEKILSLIEERKTRKPIAYIIGEKEFMGMEFKVDENVLIPRPDTEVIVEELISCAKNRLEALKEENLQEKQSLKILDMCTGSGAIALSCANYLPKDGVEIFAADISKGALKICRENASRFEIDNVSIFESDLFSSDKLSSLKKELDIIVSNPPYIEEEVILGLEVDVKDYEPMLALSGGETGMDFYNKIIEDSREFLKPGGLLVFESGHDQAEKIKTKMLDCGFTDIYFKKDIQNFDRCVVGKLI